MTPSTVIAELRRIRKDLEDAVGPYRDRLLRLREELSGLCFHPSLEIKGDVCMLCHVNFNEAAKNPSVLITGSK